MKQSQNRSRGSGAAGRLAALLLAGALMLCFNVTPALAQAGASASQEEGASSGEESSQPEEGESAPEEDGEGEAAQAPSQEEAAPQAGDSAPQTDDVPYGTLTEADLQAAQSQQYGEGMPTGPMLLLTEFEKNPVRARVKTVLGEEALRTRIFPGAAPETVAFEAQALEGEFAGTVLYAQQLRDETSARFTRPVAPGDEVYLNLYRDEAGTVRGTFGEYSRALPLLAAGAAAMVLLALLCRRAQGLKTVVLLLAACAAVRYAFVPLVRGGMAPVWAAAAVCGGLLLVAEWFYYGVKYRTLAAGLGCALSLGASAALARAAQVFLRLSGGVDAELLRALLPQIELPAGAALDLNGVLLAGVMFSVLGALLVVANTATSGADPALVPLEVVSRTALFASGCRKGASALAPVVSSLAFALLGWGTGLMCLLSLAGMPAGRILSDERVATELVRAAAGCLGLLLCIPLSAGIYALLLGVRRRKDGTLREFMVKEFFYKKQQALFGRAARRLEKSRKAALSAAGAPGTEAAPPPPTTGQAGAPPHGEPQQAGPAQPPAGGEPPSPGDSLPDGEALLAEGISLFEESPAAQEGDKNSNAPRIIRGPDDE